MRHFFIFLCVFLVSFSASAQRKRKTETTENKPVTEIKSKTPEPDSLYTTIFRTGMKYGDYQVAANALYHLMALNPQNESLKDSLVLLYNGMGSSVQAVLIAREILQKNSNNLPVLNALAESEQRLGLLKESLAAYETLYDKNQRLYDLYQVGVVSLEMQDYNDAQNNFKKALEFEPDFELAQNNLQILVAEMNKQKKTDTNNSKSPGNK
ncbi:MAG: hypothetical protein EOP53_22020 [Sphingobacteriales bacterium]|nr:MAG: hypothetical protein EOP53_22020 [Sphingobacteriales bacterium]